MPSLTIVNQWRAIGLTARRMNSYELFRQGDLALRLRIGASITRSIVGAR